MRWRRSCKTAAASSGSRSSCSTPARRKILWAEQYDFNREHDRPAISRTLGQDHLLLVDGSSGPSLPLRSRAGPTAYHLFLNGPEVSAVSTCRTCAARAARSRSAIGACAGLRARDQRPGANLSAGMAAAGARRNRAPRRSGAACSAGRSRIDPDDARGYPRARRLHAYAGRFDESLEAFGQGGASQSAIRRPLKDYADALLHCLRAGQPLEKITRAIELNPLCPDPYWWAAGGANFHLERYRRGNRVPCRACGTRAPAYRLLAASWAMLGEREKAREYVRKAKEIHPDFNVSGWLVHCADPRSEICVALRTRPARSGIRMIGEQERRINSQSADVEAETERARRGETREKAVRASVVEERCSHPRSSRVPALQARRRLVRLKRQPVA